MAYFHRFSFQREIDSLTNAGLATVDRTRRKAIYARIERLLAAQVPVIFLDWEPLLYVQPRALRGFDPNAFNNLFYNIQDWRY